MTIPIPTTVATRNTLTGKRLARVLLAVVLGLTLGEISSRHATAQDASGDLIWQILEVNGDVRVRVAGTAPTPWRRLATSDKISANAEVEAGANGHAVLAHDGSQITLSPNSQITLPNHVPNGAVYRVVQRTGTMLFKIVHATKDKFQVETPYLTTVIKGTTFSVTVNSSGGSVHVTEGAVLVRPLSGEGGLVTPGQTARVPAGSRGGVIINGRATGPATDTAQKSTKPNRAQGGKHLPAKTPAADTAKAETGKTPAIGRDDAKLADTRRAVTIVFDDGTGKPAGSGIKGYGDREAPRGGQADAKASGGFDGPSTAASNAGDADGTDTGPIGKSTANGINATAPATSNKSSINRDNNGAGLKLGHSK